MRAAKLQELEEMAAELLATARKLPSGQDRHNALQEIGRFRARITALQRLSGMAQSPQPYDAGRFRWDIRENGRPIQSSMESFATEQEAHADGRHELEKLIQVSRL
jgi:cytochrome c556